MDLGVMRDYYYNGSAEEQLAISDSSRKIGESTLNSEADLEEKNEASVLAGETDIEYKNLSRPELVEAVKLLTKSADFFSADAMAGKIKPIYRGLRNKERDAALDEFKKKGGIESDFNFIPDHYDIEFEASVKLIRDKKNKFYRDQESRREDNLKRKNELLEKLRALTHGEDAGHNFEVFKKIQNEWKSIGPVPSSHARTLWANYAALVDFFYDQRSISFELKELDRKKNLEIKEELCGRVEKLVESTDIRMALVELNSLHHEFKNTGPVPREEKEMIWNRFKAASDILYAKRDEYLAEQRKVLQQNLVEKEKLLEVATALAAFTSDRIKDWNQKTKEVMDLQKKWESTGQVSRSHARKINRAFWSAFKTFFSNKNLFFKKLDDQREKNLILKQELIQKAETLKHSTEWNKAAEEIKQLQMAWKEIGPVPEKQRNKIFQSFKATCDFFFEQRREQFSKQDKEQLTNLALKQAICEALEKGSQEKSGTLKQLHEAIEQYHGIGFIPKKLIATVKSRLDSAVVAYVHSIEGIDLQEKDRALMEYQLMGLRSGPGGDHKVHHKEQMIRKQIHNAENDIAVLQNNLEFFGRSKNAEKLKSEFSRKLEKATGDLKELKRQLKLIAAVS